MVAGLLLVKETSKRLPGKNTKDFNGKPMFVWNVLKCVDIFDMTYVSSDSESILNMARLHGAKGIKRGDDLIGETPDIPVYQHAIEHMPTNVTGVVAVHANNPTLEKNLIALTKRLVEGGAQEVMTCKPMVHGDEYHAQHNPIYGSIRGLSVERIRNYPDPYRPNPDVLIVDSSIEIETQESYDQALCQSQS